MAIDPAQFLPPDTGGPTSPGLGSTSDIIREMISLADMYIQVETSDQDISEMRAIQGKLQSRLAKEEKQAESAMGIGDAQRFMQRQTQPDPIRALIEQGMSPTPGR